MNSTVNFTLKTDIAWIRRRWVRHRFFPVKFTLQFTSLAIFFSWTEWVLKESKHTLSERREKEKKPFPESTVNNQRIGIMLKLEAIKKALSVQGQRRVLLMYFIPLYLWKQDHSHFDVFHWNTPGWLGTRIYKLRQCNQERTICSNT